MMKSLFTTVACAAMASMLAAQNITPPKTNLKVGMKLRILRCPILPTNP